MLDDGDRLDQPCPARFDCETRVKWFLEPEDEGGSVLGVLRGWLPQQVGIDEKIGGEHAGGDHQGRDHAGLDQRREGRHHGARGPRAAAGGALRDDRDPHRATLRRRFAAARRSLHESAAGGPARIRSGSHSRPRTRRRAAPEGSARGGRGHGRQAAEVEGTADRAARGLRTAAHRGAAG